MYIASLLPTASRIFPADIQRKENMLSMVKIIEDQIAVFEQGGTLETDFGHIVNARGEDAVHIIRKNVSMLGKDFGIAYAHLGSDAQCIKDTLDYMESLDPLYWPDHPAPEKT